MLRGHHPTATISCLRTGAKVLSDLNSIKESSGLKVTESRHSQVTLVKEKDKIFVDPGKATKKPSGSFCKTGTSHKPDGGKKVMMQSQVISAFEDNHTNGSIRPSQSSPIIHHNRQQRNSTASPQGANTMIGQHS